MCFLSVSDNHSATLFVGGRNVDSVAAEEAVFLPFLKAHVIQTV